MKTNVSVLKVITYCAVASSILLGLLLAVSVTGNRGTESILLNRFSLHWWESSKNMLIVGFINNIHILMVIGDISEVEEGSLVRGWKY
jgi:hypothetical protein